MSSSSDKNMSAVPQQEPCMPPEQDHYLPIANVTRIMRRILPSGAKITEEAKVNIQQCATEFISFVTSEANHICQSARRTTITAGDILSALRNLGLDDYVGPLDVFINRYRLSETDREFYSVRGESLPSDPASGGSGIGLHDPPYHDHGPPPHGALTYGPLPQGFHGPLPLGPAPHGSLPSPLVPSSHSPPPPGPYGYGMLDQSMVMGGGGDWYYQNGSGQDGTTGGDGSSSSMNGMPFFDQYGQYK